MSKTPRTDALGAKAMNSTNPREVMRDLVALCRELEAGAAAWKLDNDAIVGGAPVTPGVTVYTFDRRGQWLLDLPPLPQSDSRL